MKSFKSLCVSPLSFLLLATVFVAFAVAEDKGKNVTLKGTILCAKCTLGQEAECTTAIQVKEGDKLVTYLLDDKGAGEEYHEPICGGSRKEGTVTGTVQERNGKNYIKPTKVEYAKK
jgi:hypothetical protein